MDFHFALLQQQESSGHTSLSRYAIEYVLKTHAFALTSIQPFFFLEESVIHFVALFIYMQSLKRKQQCHKESRFPIVNEGKTF